MADKFNKKVCKYGEKCFRKNADHIKNYDHEKDVTDENSCPETQSAEVKAKEEKRDDVKKNTENTTKPKTEAVDVEKYDLNEIKDIKSLVLEVNQMQMPDDFYDFLEFCKSIDSQDPKNALSLINLELAGIYDLLLSGYKHNYKTYSRYFYDPPEFQTVLKEKSAESMLHFGYFRDDPSEMPSFVGVNEAKIDCKIHIKGDNLFGALNWYLEELISGKEHKSSTSSDELKEFKKKFNDWCDKHFKNDKTFSLQLKTPRIKSREKKINCKLFHTAGLVVPVDSNGFGYRDVPESYDAQRKLFTNFCLKDENDSTNKAKKAKADEKIQEIISFIQFANDECDYGMGLEFGLNMFSQGELALHKFIKVSMVNSYNLLGRELYSEILKEHLKIRKFNV